MGFSGFYEYLCAEGHYFSNDVNSTREERCDVCGNDPAFQHLVDETNGTCADQDCVCCRSARSLLLVKNSMTVSRCPTCDHVEIEEDETYVLPPPAPWRPRLVN